MVDYVVLGKEIILDRECDIMRWEEIVKRYPDKYIMLANIKYDVPRVNGLVRSPDKFTATVFGVYEEDEVERNDRDWFALANAGISCHCEKTTQERLVGLLW